MRHAILLLLLVVSSIMYPQDTLFNYWGTLLIDTHNYNDSAITFGAKIDQLLQTEVRNENRIRRMIVKQFGPDYDTSLTRDRIYKYKRQGIDIFPDYYDKLNFMEIHLSALNSKETQSTRKADQHRSECKKHETDSVTGCDLVTNY